MEVGIVGLPNVGKSTLFNALLKVAQAQAGNFPFTTIEPNIGVVAVPDERLDQLAALVKPAKITPATVRFVDIAGLVRGASKGEGLGNKFLAHIREVDAIAMVVRIFLDPNVTHVAGKIDPADDIRTIQLELILADLATIEKRVDAVGGRAKTGDKDTHAQLAFFEKIQRVLENEQLAREVGELTEDETRWLKELQLLTSKPFLYIGNVSEDQIGTGSWELERYPILPISAKLEAELAELTEEEQAEYLQELNLREPGRDALIRAAYDVLGLATYLTAGPKEVRAWTITKGMTAPQAAGVIHGDFERGFIAADVIPWQKFVEAGGWAEAKTKGWVKTEGKTYIFKDGDVTVFRFNV
ncbi:MAG: redox-regulated ATPase YchF [Patescibacteria group bacterium]